MADDDMLAAFVKPDFDSKDFVHTVVQRDSVSDDLAHLRQGIAVLESQLREQVVSHHGRLIEQVSHAKDLEVLVDTVTSGVSRLQASLGSVRAKIREPYEVVASKTALPREEPRALRPVGAPVATLILARRCQD